MFVTGERRRLKSDAVPSVFPFRPQPSPSALKRKERAAQRQHHKPQEPTQGQDIAGCGQDPGLVPHSDIPDIGMEIEICPEALPVDDGVEICDRPTTSKCDQEIQCNLPVARCHTIENFIDNDRLILFYTGFKNYEQFMLLFTILGPCVNHLPISCHLKPKDQLFLTLMKLRLASEDFELATLFDLSEKCISKLLICWINFLYYQLSEIDIWPSRSVVTDTMPQRFKDNFPTTRVIVDATEIGIQKPGHVENQSASFSTYKNTNTMKVLVGCTPRGLISFVSDAYGGSASDRQICERSDLIKKPLFDSGDSIMADRGFNVQDLFATKNVHVNIPTFLKGKSQLAATDVAKDRKIASKRIHVERVIGLAKTYKILKQPLPAKRVRLGNRVIKVCFLLCNFKTCIVGRYS